MAPRMKWVPAIRKVELKSGTSNYHLHLFQFQYNPKNPGCSEDSPAIMLRGVHKISETRRTVAPGGSLVRTASITYLMTHHGQTRGKSDQTLTKS